MPPRGPWTSATLIAGTLLASLVLNVLPLRVDYAWLRPEWPLLVLVFWTIHSPTDVGVGSAWLLGLVLDGIEGSPLGQHAMALSVVSFLVLSLHTRLSFFSLLQQSLVIVMLVAVYHVFSIWIQNVSAIATGNLLFLWSCLTSALCWPLIRILLGKIAA